MRTAAFHLASVVLAVVAIAAGCSRSGTPENLDAETSRELMEKGGRIAAESFAALSGRLQAALDAGGVAEALHYCHTAALPLTDSLSIVHGATIRRTSLSYRNRANAPVDWEAGQLERYRQQQEQGEDLSPVLVRLDERRVAFAAPILTMPRCLQCHGTIGEDIQEADYAMVRTFYPEDKAVGFRPGQLRGMWSITFDRP